MPQIARRVHALAAVALLVAGCGDTPTDRPAGAPSSVAAPIDGSVDAASPSASASTPARQPHILVFTATGTATVRSLTYVLDGKSTTVRSARLPWRLSVDVPVDGLRHEWSLTVVHGKGRVEALGIFNGQVTGRSVGSGSGTGTVSVGGSVLG
jgi:hypothetical protein